MLGLDDRIGQLSTGGSVGLAVLVALLLGLRHATDPDHLTAVSTLVLCGDDRGLRRARRLGLAWGLGHATTLIALGLPVVLFRRLLPEAVEHAAEFAIGMVIIALAVRLLVRWRRGSFRAHPQPHRAMGHAQPHGDAHGRCHAPVDALGRTSRAAYAIGLIHGTGGSAGVGLLLIGATPGHAAAALALLLFAAATAGSMALVSTAWGLALSRAAAVRRLPALAPVFGTMSLAFGLWYGGAALA